MYSEVYQLCEKYEQVELFHVGWNNPYIIKCDKLCNERLDAEGLKAKNNPLINGLYF